MGGLLDTAVGNIYYSLFTNSRYAARVPLAIKGKESLLNARPICFHLWFEMYKVHLYSHLLYHEDDSGTSLTWWVCSCCFTYHFINLFVVFAIEFTVPIF